MNKTGKHLKSSVDVLRQICAAEPDFTVSVKPEAARDFRLQLQQARENALKDAEAWDGIIHVVERLGSFLLGSVGDLGKYQFSLENVAQHSPLATDIPAQWRNVHTPFDLLYSIVTDARNDALHIGATARHLTTHAIELGLILEDALRSYEMDNKNKHVSDYMVRDPVCAHLWQPVSFIRQQMLTNSFSYLPVQAATGQWCLVSDLQVAKYLQHSTNSETQSDMATSAKAANKERKRRLATSLEKATAITPLEAKRVLANTEINSAMLEGFNGKPILVFRDDDKKELVGILTAFDLL